MSSNSKADCKSESQKDECKRRYESGRVARPLLRFFFSMEPVEHVLEGRLLLILDVASAALLAPSRLWPARDVRPREKP
jgi:hypothetical protein